MKLPNGAEVKKEQINEKLVTYILAENHKNGQTYPLISLELEKLMKYFQQIT